jgi:hypothetical protein
MPGAAQRIASGFKKGAADAAMVMGRIDEQRPDRAVARVAGGKTQDLAFLFPDPDAGMLGELRVIRVGHQAWIAELVLLHGEADLADAVALLGTGAADMPGHAGTYR